VSIYGSKEVFVREYQNLLADRLFVLTNYDTDQEVKSVELLKLRFGDAAFHTCEVMLKDIADSKRTDHAIHQLLTEAADVPMHAQILSRLFWPSNFKKEEVTYPATLKKYAMEQHMGNNVLWIGSPMRTKPSLLCSSHRGNSSG